MINMFFLNQQIFSIIDIKIKNRQLPLRDQKVYIGLDLLHFNEGALVFCCRTKQLCHQNSRCLHIL